MDAVVWGEQKMFLETARRSYNICGLRRRIYKKPNIPQVCAGLTGHAEVVRVVWNKEEIDISDLLKMFWECHNPTQKNRQGNDIGTQYRSAIFYEDKKHEKIILASGINIKKSLLKNKSA